MNFSFGDVLLMPMMFTNVSGIKRRPVVVVYDSGDADLLVVPITSQVARSIYDISIEEWEKSGLRLPSIARIEKLATVEKSIVIKRLGRIIAKHDVEEMRSALQKLFDKILVT